MECWLALFWKIRVPFGTPFWVIENIFFFYFFQLTYFGHTLWNMHGQKNWFFYPSKSIFGMHEWDIIQCMRYNLTRTQSVKTSISDNFLVCGPIWVYDASFWLCWPKESFKIILGSIRCPEKNRAKTLELHGFLCRNARSPNWVQVVSLWLCWPKDSCECIFRSIGRP